GESIWGLPMDFCLGFLLVVGLIAVVGHGIWAFVAWVFHETFGARRPPAPREPDWTCRACATVNPPRLRHCRHCLRDRHSLSVAELEDLAAAERQLRELRRLEPAYAQAFTQVLERVAVR